MRSLRRRDDETDRSKTRTGRLVRRRRRLKSFLMSLMLSESRGHSQEKESLAQLVALVRDLSVARPHSPSARSWRRPLLPCRISPGHRDLFAFGFQRGLLQHCCCLAVKAAAMVERRSWSR